MTDTRQLRARYRRILRFAARYMVLEWWFELVLPRFGLERIAARRRLARAAHIARSFHSLAVDLGGLMIKVGQFMSSRLDVLPGEITRELEGLQDEVPAVDFTLIRESVERELGIPLERAYDYFDATPVAAASFGQVHRARLTPSDAMDVGFSGVVVKVQRPGIADIITVDLAALRRVARWLSRVRFVSRRVDLPALLEEFAVISLREIDYLNEGSNAERFAENFADDPRIGAPDVVWERSTRRILTLADATAIKINDHARLIAAGIDPAEVADELSRAMFEQLFIHRFFHADPHPGNIFVTPADPARADVSIPAWTLTFIDFGMMGEVPESLSRGLQRLIIAAAARDAPGLVASVRDMGILLRTAESAPLERAMGELFDRFGGMGFSELQQVDPQEFRAFGNEFSEVVRTMPFQLPENFLLIIRAVSVTSGVASDLNPGYNVWTAIEPFAARLARNEGGGTVKELAKQALSSAGLILRLPQQLESVATLMQRGQLAVETPSADKRLRAIEQLVRRVLSSVLFTALLIGGILLRATDPTFGLVLMISSALPLTHALFAGVFTRTRLF
ncbi:AarF/ABC1/UbiB kinase family protein [Salinibacterium sp. NSLL150]|uniref:ABC1 kinase family protein n=1 Tax=unclassified Salinibacterium TaxID=2632331 RepID=UPI0018CFD306|nr:MULTISPECIES: AarF/UbiB family protein [unclassified Salinibacterium]MBH0099172.1 AarF/ABC1/UbiB kinase family protein [Salinibacterium sp. NSLL35]MBH0101926.1 AarF/ABC1/UbiB kinase family protein [Salinibacterium sp. NSLL150]MBH0104686.1 AarF/ABC1/UbiB kinase family protein [Salinibacterium sp. NSLL16]MBH0107446.1 AarF/ABC1/UbiB kinase family protein [Salinibacterium sp. NSLL17]